MTCDACRDAKPDGNGVTRCPNPDHPVVGRRIHKTIARPDGGGYVTAMITPVHAHTCGAWRMGKSYRPCSCGASDAFDQFTTEHGDDPWTGIANTLTVPWVNPACQEAS